MALEYQVYVLQNVEGRHYIGVSENVAVRLQQHNDGISKWTRKYTPWKLIWASELMDLTNARKLENLLKRQKGGDGFYRITGLPRQAHNPAAAGS